MGGRCVRLTWLCGLAALAAAVIAYRQWDAVVVPSGILDEDRLQAKIVHLSFLAILHLDILVHAIGLPSSVSRSMQNSIVNLMQTGRLYGILSDDEVKVSFDVFDGVPVRVYEKRSASSVSAQRPALLFIHGGGFLFFSNEWGDPSVRELVRRLDYVAVSPEYRLAPEHPFPAAFDDCVAVTNFVLREHSRLNVDPGRVIVAGDSAGGNLAAAVAAHLKKRLRLQILIYPYLQAFDFATPSYEDNREGFVIGKDANIIVSMLYGNLSLSYLPAFQANRHIDPSVRAKYERHVHSDLLPAHLNVTSRTSQRITSGDSAVYDAVRHVVLDPRFMPLMADSLDDYPDAYIVTAQHDILRDDGLIYATRLSRAKNVKAKLEHYDHGFHAFFHFVDGPLATAVARAAMEDLVKFLRSL